MSISWDDDSSNAQFQRPKKPLWTIKLDDPDNEKEILAWLNGEITYLEQESDERVKRTQRNLAIYKGFQYHSQDAKDSNREINDSREKVMKKVPVNHLYELTENRMSRLIKYKPAVAILPSNDEFSDKVSAKLTKNLLDHIWYENKFEGALSPQVARDAMLAGESYLFTLWNPDKGDLSPAYKKSKANADKEGRKIPLLTETGEQEKDEAGNPVYVTKPIKVGDIEYKIEFATEVFLQRKEKWEDVQYLFVRSVEPVETLRLRYKDKASKIKPTGEAEIYDYEKMELSYSSNDCVVWTLWHKRIDELDSGRKIVFTKDVVLSNEEFPFSHHDLPCVRFTDIDQPKEVHGRSFYEIIKGLVATHNNLTNLIIRNQVLVAHPKWMMPVGAAKLDQLSNDITIVQFKGPQPPTLVQANPTPAEIFNFREQLKNEFVQIAGVFPISRGETPPGIKAGIALQFLSEQEAERFNSLILKWNEFVRQVAIQTIAVAGDYYDASDERMIRVIGTNNKWMSQFFDVAHLSKDYDIRVQNSSALPQSKAARIQTLMDLNQQFPGLLPSDQILDMLDLAQNEKFVDAVTNAVRTAEAENEKLLEADSQELASLEPMESDHHIKHWIVHTRQLQEFGFKYMTPPEKRKQLEDHILVHEMMMVDKAAKNAAFAQQLQSLDLFPIFFVPEPQILSAPAPMDGAQAAALPPPVGGAFQPEPELPVNSAQVGGEPQEDVAPPVVEEQALEGPVPPTGAI